MRLNCFDIMFVCCLQFGAFIMHLMSLLLDFKDANIQNMKLSLYKTANITSVFVVMTTKVWNYGL